MVKGTSRQVIMVHSPDPKLFEQAIFILKDGAVREGVTDEALLREAKEAIRREPKGNRGIFWGIAGLSLGAVLVGILWAVSALL